MSVNAGRAKLRDASKKLMVRWEGIRHGWRDEISKNYEENHIKPLMIKLRKAAEAMERMDLVLNHVRHDCT